MDIRRGPYGCGERGNQIIWEPGPTGKRGLLNRGKKISEFIVSAVVVVEGCNVRSVRTPCANLHLKQRRSSFCGTKRKQVTAPVGLYDIEYKLSTVHTFNCYLPKTEI